MKIAFNSGKVYDLESFGVVIASGYGDPTPEVQARINAEFGFKSEHYCDVAALLKGEYDEALIEYLNAANSDGASQ